MCSKRSWPRKDIARRKYSLQIIDLVAKIAVLYILLQIPLQIIAAYHFYHILCRILCKVCNFTFLNAGGNLVRLTYVRVGFDQTEVSLRFAACFSPQFSRESIKWTKCKQAYGPGDRGGGQNPRPLAVNFLGGTQMDFFGRAKGKRKKIV